MGIFKKAEVKKTLTVLEAFQQAFGGVPDDAECYRGILGSHSMSHYATIMHPTKGLLFWNYDNWEQIPYKDYRFPELGIINKNKKLPKFFVKPQGPDIINDFPADKFKEYFSRAPQYDAFLEEYYEGYANKDTYLNDLMAGEDY